MTDYLAINCLNEYTFSAGHCKTLMIYMPLKFVLFQFFVNTAMQSLTIPVVKGKRLKGSIEANHRLTLELAITKRSDIHT